MCRSGYVTEGPPGAGCAVSRYLSAFLPLKRLGGACDVNLQCQDLQLAATLHSDMIQGLLCLSSFPQEQLSALLSAAALSKQSLGGF